MTPFSKLNEAQQERLHLLSEECAELVMANSKALRHGLESWKPPNRETIVREAGDVIAAIVLLIASHDLDPNVAEPMTADEMWDIVLHAAQNKITRFLMQDNTKPHLVHTQPYDVLATAKRFLVKIRG